MKTPSVQGTLTRPQVVQTRLSSKMPSKRSWWRFSWQPGMVFQDLRGGSISLDFEKTVVNSHVSRKTPRVILMFQALTWIFVVSHCRFVRRVWHPSPDLKILKRFCCFTLDYRHKENTKKKRSAKNTHLGWQTFPLYRLFFGSTSTNLSWWNPTPTQSSASVTEVENSWTAKVKRSRGCKAPRFQALKCSQLPFALVDTPHPHYAPPPFKQQKKNETRPA